MFWYLAFITCLRQANNIAEARKGFGRLVVFLFLEGSHQKKESSFRRFLCAVVLSIHTTYDSYNIESML